METSALAIYIINSVDKTKLSSIRMGENRLAINNVYLSIDFAA